MWRMLKPLTAKATVEATQVFGTNKADWLPAVLAKVAEDQLPVEYGGTIVYDKPVYVPDPKM
jgi:hypothetical protein